MSYFNTTGLTGPTLFDAVNNARNQDEIILEFFNSHKLAGYSPCDIHKMVFDNDTPLTSVRRSISNLTASGKLIKTDHFKTGVYGKKTYLWKLKL